MEDKPEASIPFATGGIVTGTLHGVMGCMRGYACRLIPPKRDEPEPYDERETNP
jgi:hypothetical protein